MVRGRSFLAPVHRLRIADQLVARDRVDHAAPFHQVVVLRAGERGRLAGVDDFEAAAEPHRVRGANQVGVEACAGPEVAGAGPSVPAMNGDAIVRVAGHREDGTPNRSSAIPQLDDVADDLTVLATLPGRLAAGPQPVGRRRADNHGVVPGQPGDGLGKLLQPAVVGESAVENRRVVSEGDLETVARLRGLRRGQCGHVHRDRLRRDTRCQAPRRHAASGATRRRNRRQHRESFQCSRTMSWPDRSGRSLIAARSSCADLPS